MKGDNKNDLKGFLDFYLFDYEDKYTTYYL
jgi:hypothetical protein